MRCCGDFSRRSRSTSLSHVSEKSDHARRNCERRLRVSEVTGGVVGVVAVELSSEPCLEVGGRLTEVEKWLRLSLFDASRSLRRSLERLCRWLASRLWFGLTLWRSGDFRCQSTSRSTLLHIPRRTADPGLAFGDVRQPTLLA